MVEGQEACITLDMIQVCEIHQDLCNTLFKWRHGEERPMMHATYKGGSVIDVLTITLDGTNFPITTVGIQFNRVVFRAAEESINRNCSEIDRYEALKHLNLETLGQRLSSNGPNPFLNQFVSMGLSQGNKE